MRRPPAIAVPVLTSPPRVPGSGAGGAGAVAPRAGGATPPGRARGAPAVVLAGAALLLALAALPAGAQGQAQGQAQGPGQAQGQAQMQAGQLGLRSPILTIDTDRLFAETRFGKRVQRDLQAAGEALAAENTRIFDELTAEDRSLAARRSAMEAEAFRAEADAFDAKVQRIRAEQDAKERAFEQSVVEARLAFFNAVNPVLDGLMMQAGAAVIVDRRSVLRSVSAVDITDEAIATLDAEVGEGEGLLPAPQVGGAPLDAPRAIPGGAGPEAAAPVPPGVAPTVPPLAPDEPAPGPAPEGLPMVPPPAAPAEPPSGG